MATCTRLDQMEPGEDWSHCYVDDLAFVLQR